MVQEMLNLDKNKVKRARTAAYKIATNIQKEIDLHTTTTVERTVARLFGIDDVDSQEVPLPNVVVDQVEEAEELDKGIAFWLGNAMVYHDLTAQEVAEEVGKGNINLTNLPLQDGAEVKKVVDKAAREMTDLIKNNRKERTELKERLGEGPKPQLYVIVATGNIYEDAEQAKSAARQGADIVAVIRTTGQSLLDYVPYGATTEGFGGTYATQENFRIMREALDEVGEEVGRYIQLVNYCSGLCMPEIAAMGAFERLDMMLNDAMYGILFRDINMKRTFIDQYFSRLINAYAGVIINTGEDNYLTTADAYEEAHTVLASDFINEQMALKAGLKEEQLGLGHAFEMDPDMKNGFLYEIAQAQMLRQIFPNSPLKYMPPTKYMTGDVFKGHLQDAMFNLASVITGQGIQLLGMLTEAIHTPFLHDRALSIENAQYIMNNACDLGNEIEFKEDGIIQNRANEVLINVVNLLEDIENKGLKETISEGTFAGVKRTEEGGKGVEGVIKKGPDYYNPFLEIMSNELK
ncbi:lysine 5,6-aminomutase subunit alpha [Sporohalobacter salinus]|uniref:lysine 5,6-aminomutase subunit alpha n=1 Tax=Sporohalobacter salinus TaxID=1494606 RepID=UPI0019621AB8|nr:lysine 5,6-aminomutase subunit alpha [Sporohalobacter salinus]MBM7622631.1 beta-lysine 5,6-aminomutase alpha subunit [Sporohalobacter salinus]